MIGPCAHHMPEQCRESQDAPSSGAPLTELPGYTTGLDTARRTQLAGSWQAISRTQGPDLLEPPSPSTPSLQISQINILQEGQSPVPTSSSNTKAVSQSHFKVTQTPGGTGPPGSHPESGNRTKFIFVKCVGITWVWSEMLLSTPRRVFSNKKGNKMKQSVLLCASFTPEVLERNQVLRQLQAQGQANCLLRNWLPVQW